jgi:hypothetical protein
MTTHWIIPEDRGDVSFTWGVFFTVYVHNGLAIVLLMVSMGCPLPLMPNILTSAAMLAIVMSDNPW